MQVIFVDADLRNRAIPGVAFSSQLCHKCSWLQCEQTYPYPKCTLLCVLIFIMLMTTQTPSNACKTHIKYGQEKMPVQKRLYFIIHRFLLILLHLNSRNLADQLISQGKHDGILKQKNYIKGRVQWRWCLLLFALTSFLLSLHSSQKHLKSQTGHFKHCYDYL